MMQKPADSQLTEDAGPYLGLRPFEIQDAPFFFGRQRDVELLAANLRTARVSLVYGESGVGKSSLIRAGLAPDLAQRSVRSRDSDYEGDSFAAVVSTIGEEPTAAVSRAIASAAGVSTTATSLLDAIETALGTVARLLIVLDQFEEYLAAPREDTFDDELIRAITRPDLSVNFMIAIREDSVSKLDRFRSRAQILTANPIRIEPLAIDAADEAVTGPLAVYNARRDTTWEAAPGFSDAVLEATLADRVDLGFGGRGGLEKRGLGATKVVEAAYLQIVLRSIWATEHARGSTCMRTETLDELGGVSGIVRSHLDGIMSQFRRRPRDVAAAAFRYLVTPSGTKVPYSAWDLAKMTRNAESEVEDVLARLAAPDMRIVRPVTDSARGDRRYEIYHDRLADPILDWRSREDKKRDRARIVQIAFGLLSAMSAGAAAVLLAVAESWVSVVVMGVYAVLYAFAAANRNMTLRLLESYERMIRSDVPLFRRIWGKGIDGRQERTAK